MPKMMGMMANDVKGEGSMGAVIYKHQGCDCSNSASNHCLFRQKATRHMVVCLLLWMFGVYLVVSVLLE